MTYEANFEYSFWELKARVNANITSKNYITVLSYVTSKLYFKICSITNYKNILIFGSQCKVNILSSALKSS